MDIDSLIKQLKLIKDSYGNIDVYIWNDGIAKRINYCIERETVDGSKKGCFLEL